MSAPPPNVVTIREARPYPAEQPSTRTRLGAFSIGALTGHIGHLLADVRRATDGWAVVR